MQYIIFVHMKFEHAGFIKKTDESDEQSAHSTLRPDCQSGVYKFTLKLRGPRVLIITYKILDLPLAKRFQYSNYYGYRTAS